jgi:hypothetical protein
MKLSTPFLGMGMGGGLVAAVYAIGVEIQYISHVMSVILVACASIGLLCASVVFAKLQQRCDRYERLLSENKIQFSREPEP